MFPALGTCSAKNDDHAMVDLYGQILGARPDSLSLFSSFSCSCQENSAKIIGWISSSNFVVGAPSGKPWICHGDHPYVVPLIPYSVQVHARVHTSLINLDLKHDQFPHKMMA